MDFTGFETIKNIPTGDFRDRFPKLNGIHLMGVKDGDIAKNEIVVYIECDRDLVGYYPLFTRVTPPEEIEGWFISVLESHKQDCQYHNLNPLGHNSDWFKFAELMKIISGQDFEWLVEFSEGKITLLNVEIKED